MFQIGDQVTHCNLIGRRGTILRIDGHMAEVIFDSDKYTCTISNLAPYIGNTELINHPSHYGGDTTYEAIKVIEAWGLGFCIGNCVKYICRADKKGDRRENLEKALWYLQRELENMK